MRCAPSCLSPRIDCCDSQAPSKPAGYSEWCTTNEKAWRRKHDLSVLTPTVFSPRASGATTAVPLVEAPLSPRGPRGSRSFAVEEPTSQRARKATARADAKAKKATDKAAKTKAEDDWNAVEMGAVGRQCDTFPCLSVTHHVAVHRYPRMQA